MPLLARILDRIDGLDGETAVANVAADLEQRAREEWIVAGLALRVDRRVAERTATSARAAARVGRRAAAV